MNKMRVTTLGLGIVMGGWACSAQQATIPFKQISQDAKLLNALALPGHETSSSLDAGILSSELASSGLASSGLASSSSSGSGFTRPAPVAARRRPLGANFYLLNGIDIGMAVLDVEMTQHCIATHKCREGNPMMPSSQAGALSVSIGLVGVTTWASYRMKKHESHIWWLSPTGGIAGHVVGVASSLIKR